jgi:phosphopantothenate---cysteine ligase (CTP)
VGFKLLYGVSRQELLDTGLALLQKNRCDFVLANDAQSFADGGHTGFLIAPCGEPVRFEGKRAIARGIVRAVKEKALEVNR